MASAKPKRTVAEEWVNTSPTFSTIPHNSTDSIKFDKYAKLMAVKKHQSVFIKIPKVMYDVILGILINALR